MSGLYPSAWIHSFFGDTVYDPSSRANVYSALVMYGVLLVFVGVVVFASHYPKYTRTRSNMRRFLRFLDISQKSMTNVTKVLGKVDVRRRKSGDGYIDNEYRGTVVGGLVSGMLYIVGTFMLVWTLYACLHDVNAPIQFPDDLFSEMTADQPPYLRQRDVQTIPYSSLESGPRTYLNYAISDRDNLYVVDVTSGHDWGATCVPSDPTFLAMPYTDKLRLLFSTSAGTCLLQNIIPGTSLPTTAAQLRASGSLGIQTDNCIFVGGQPCSTMFEDLTGYEDIISLAWAFGYPGFFDDMTFEERPYNIYTLCFSSLHYVIRQSPMSPSHLQVSMTPSEQYPNFGTGTSAVRTYVYPGTFNEYLQTDNAEPQPMIKGSTQDIGYWTVGVGWLDGLAFPASHFTPSQQEEAADIMAAARSALGDVPLNPFTTVTFDDNGRQDPDTMSGLWDEARLMSYTVAPIPLVVASGSESGPRPFSHVCSQNSGVYFGGLCEGLFQGNVNESSDLSVSIRHTVSSQVSQVTFHNLAPWSLMGDVVLLLLSLFGFQALLELVATTVSRSLRRCKKDAAMRRASSAPNLTDAPQANVHAIPEQVMNPPALTPNAVGALAIV
ncbi:hypothetical protein KIPB_003469 [Kipferlia bialata]|uniref:Uncharacterized protein n=1 Tax=Kipferlia bialata TaxID=797122 RepID=A0A9K3GHA3_9EUKA|nr:hypothetical protein KIPB_003469 [Kipferlia bialata]|eukprot:g3469.t1